MFCKLCVRNGEAQYTIAWRFFNLPKTDKNRLEAARWFSRAATNLHARAQANLGVMFLNGDGVKKDEGTGVRLIRMAADQGDALGQYNLGKIYINGTTVPKSMSESYKWVMLAAAQHYGDSEKMLAAMSQTFPQDDVKYAMRRAAEFVPTKVSNPDIPKVE